MRTGPGLCPTLMGSSLSGSPLLYLWLPSLSVCCTDSKPQYLTPRQQSCRDCSANTTITLYQILMINLLWVMYNLQVILSLWLNPNSENLYQMISILTVRDSPGRLCAPNAGGPGSIPAQRTRSHMLQVKILHNATKAQQSEGNKY